MSYQIDLVVASGQITMIADRETLKLAQTGVRQASTQRTSSWYAMIVKVTSTEFRKNLFQLFERALQGEFVEVVHKGRLVRLVPGDKPSKISRLIQRDTVAGTFADLETAQRQLDAEMLNAWEAKWNPNHEFVP